MRIYDDERVWVCGCAQNISTKKSGGSSPHRSFGLSGTQMTLLFVCIVQLHLC